MTKIDLNKLNGHNGGFISLPQGKEGVGHRSLKYVEQYQTHWEGGWITYVATEINIKNPKSQLSNRIRKRQLYLNRTCMLIHPNSQG